MLPATKVFQGGDRHSLFQIGLIILVDETYVSLQRNQFVLEAVACNSLFPSENWVSFWKEYFLQFIVIKVEKDSFSFKYSYSAMLKKHMKLLKKTMYVRSRSI
jgi:hypothetical protein